MLVCLKESLLSTAKRQLAHPTHAFLNLKKLYNLKISIKNLKITNIYFKLLGC